jgi:hypothetical protein
MNPKASMLEAVKRKRYQIQQHEEDATGEHADGQSSQDGDDELAPVGGSGKKDALMGGKPDTEGEPGNTRDPMKQGQTKLGEEGGFDHEEHSSPENSKNLFQDPKKDTHDSVDLNAHRNMAGDGSNSKYDKMGVDDHKDVRMQSSKMAGLNARKGEALKAKSRGATQSAMNIHEPDAGMGDDVPDAFGNHEQQKGFPAAKSKINRFGSKSIQPDQDEEGANGKGGLYADDRDSGAEDDEDSLPKGSAMKRARGKLEGFLSKMKG